MFRKALFTVHWLIQSLLILLIIIYQYTLRYLLGPCCRFYPTCSDFAKQALLECGIIKGSLLTIKRLLRCQPYHPGGYDPVPSNCKSNSLGINHGN